MKRRFLALVLASLLGWAAAGGLRLTGTPTVFLNGYRVKGFLDPEAYLELIEMVEDFSQDAPSQDAPSQDGPSQDE